MQEWYEVHNMEQLDTPALVIYPERVVKNIEVLKGFVDDVAKIRPHVKTNKCAQVVRLMLQAGISKYKCATIAEAEMLAIEDAKDVLLAYQPVGPKVRRFCELQHKYKNTDFSCLIDNPGSVADLSALATEFNQEIRVFIDLNVGMNRTGIVAGKDAFALYRYASSLPGIRFAGLHAYDGHLRDTDLTLRKQKCDDAFKPVALLAGRIAEDAKIDPIIVAGGSPTYPIHARRPGVEASPGTFVFWDYGYAQVLKEQPFVFAALVTARVISLPDAHTICVDLGHKSIASENPLTQRVYFLNATGLTPVGHSEEHLVLRSENDHGLLPGDVLYGVPHHICPTVALYEEAAVCRNGTIEASWPIVSRKRKITV